MAKLLVYYAHPGHEHSHANRAMAAEAKDLEGITFVDRISSIGMIHYLTDNNRADLGAAICKAGTG